MIRGGLWPLSPSHSVFIAGAGMCVSVCVSVMDVLQMVSAPSNYAVDTGGSRAQRSLRTYTPERENRQEDVLEVILNVLFL